MKKSLLTIFILAISMMSFGSEDDAFATSETQVKSPTLSQNYPNPAKNKTRINVSFSGEEGTLIVYNVLGKEVERIVVREKTVYLNVANYPDGIYLYTFQADGEKVTKRMTVKKN